MKLDIFKLKNTMDKLRKNETKKLLTKEEVNYLVENGCDIKNLDFSSYTVGEEKVKDRDFLIRMIDKDILGESLKKNIKNLEALPKEMIEKKYLKSYLKKEKNYYGSLHLEILNEEELANIIKENRNFKDFWNQNCYTYFDDKQVKRSKEDKERIERHERDKRFRKGDELKRFISIEEHRKEINEWIQNILVKIINKDKSKFDDYAIYLNYENEKLFTDYLIENGMETKLTQNQITEEVFERLIDINLKVALSKGDKDLFKEEHLETFNEKINKNMDKEVLSKILKFVPYENQTQEFIDNILSTKERFLFEMSMGYINIEFIDNDILKNVLNFDLNDSLNNIKWNDKTIENLEKFLEEEKDIHLRINKYINDDDLWKMNKEYQKRLVMEDSFAIVQKYGKNFFKLEKEKQTIELFQYAVTKSSEEKLNYREIMRNIDNINEKLYSKEFFEKCFYFSPSDTWKFLKGKNLLEEYFQKKFLNSISRHTDIIKDLPNKFLNDENLIRKIIMSNDYLDLDKIFTETQLEYLQKNIEKEKKKEIEKDSKINQGLNDTNGMNF